MAGAAVLAVRPIIFKISRKLASHGVSRTLEVGVREDRFGWSKECCSTLSSCWSAMSFGNDRVT